MEIEKTDYNSDPVYYCKNCLSLNIRGDILGFDYCDDCGSTNIENCLIEEWEKLFENNKGYNYIEHK